MGMGEKIDDFLSFFFFSFLNKYIYIYIRIYLFFSVNLGARFEKDGGEFHYPWNTMLIAISQRHNGRPERDRCYK